MACDVAEIEALEAAQDEAAASAQRESAEPPDPLIGSIIADRYEVLNLKGVGGMARVYRALQRSLDREVVIKVISPDLLAEDEITADEAVARFMVEAQAASKLNHPNVVSVFDFGRTPSAEGGLLFMVMEFLSGSDLRTVLDTDPELPFSRIASIVQQTLAALAEAHFLGIAHRDIKPENIILEPTRHGRDLVKVIDFGLARIGALQTVTRVGQTVGTPHYMAPEQIAGAALGSGDLYSVAVVLFELLTGRVPFDGETPLAILLQHLEAPRPDPRDVAPHRDIPDALAGVCLRAMHVHPEQRWPDAESFSAALMRAAGAQERGSRASIPDAGEWPPISLRASLPPAAPERPSRPPPPATPVSILPPRVPPRPRPQDRAETAANAPLRGRDGELAWASSILAGGATGKSLGVYGAPGTGRTRLFGAIADAAKARGFHVLRLRAAPAPRGEVSLGAAPLLIRLLTAEDANDSGLASGAAAGRDASAAAGLRGIFSRARGRSLPGEDASRAEVAAAFGWAARRAVEQAGEACVLLAIDDADALDSASLTALIDALEREPLPKLITLTTSEAPLPLPRQRREQRALRGLSPADAARLLQWLGGSPEGIADGPAAAEFEPLYIEFLRRFRLDGSPGRSPASLVALAETGLAALAPAQRRLMLVAALIGGGSRADLGTVGRSEDVARALDPLLATGMLEATSDGDIRVAHAIFGRVAMGMAPSAAIADLHMAAADWLSTETRASEMRTYHAVRGHPDFETFLLVEDCAAQRAALGDHDGAVEVLRSGLRAGQTLLQHGDVEAGGSACVVFGQKLGATLRGLDRCEDALALLEECLRPIPAGNLARVGILEELSRAAGSLGKRREAEVWRTEALGIARRLGARDVVQRLVAMTRE